MKGRLLNVRRAAEYFGYEPASSSSRDPQIRAFYEMARGLGIPKTKIGRSVRFEQADLDTAKQRRTVAAAHVDRTLSPIQQLASAHARGERLDMRRRRAGAYPRAVAGGAR